MDDRVSPISLERDIFYLNVLQESSLINRVHLKFIPQSPQKKDAPEHCSEWQATNIKSKILISISSEETQLILTQNRRSTKSRITNFCRIDRIPLTTLSISHRPT